MCQSPLLFYSFGQVAAFLEIHDIAGLVKGAHEGQGLGNNFLSHIRAVDGIFHVLRKIATLLCILLSGHHMESANNPNFYKLTFQY